MKRGSTYITLERTDSYVHLVERVLLILGLPYGSFCKFAKANNVTRQAVQHWMNRKNVPFVNAQALSRDYKLPIELLSPKNLLQYTSLKPDFETLIQEHFEGEDLDYLLKTKKFPCLKDYCEK